MSSSNTFKQYFSNKNNIFNSSPTTCSGAESVKQIPSYIEEIKSSLDKDKYENAVVNSSELITLLESKLFADELAAVAEECVEGTALLSRKFLELQLVGPALSLTFCRFNLVKKYYRGEIRLRRLRAIGVPLQNISICLSCFKRKREIQKCYPLMEEILKEMQKINLSDLKLKCIDVAWFMKFYGFCCNEAEDFSKSIEINKQAIAIMETVFSEESCQYLVLGLCYHALGKAYDNSTRFKAATPAYHKAMNMYKKANQWPTDHEKDTCVSLIENSLERIKKASPTIVVGRCAKTKKLETSFKQEKSKKQNPHKRSVRFVKKEPRKRVVYSSSNVKE